MPPGVHSRVLRVAAWIAAVVDALLLVLTFVLHEYSYRFHPDLLHALMYPVPAVAVVAQMASALMASGLVYAFVERKGRPHRIAAGGAPALLPLALLLAALAVVVGLTTNRAGGTCGPQVAAGLTELGETSRSASDIAWGLPAPFPLSARRRPFSPKPAARAGESLHLQITWRTLFVIVVVLVCPTRPVVCCLSVS